MRWLVPSLVLLAACEDGPSPETLVDDVQVIAAVADPPVAVPGETWTLRAHVADPQNRGAQVLVWSCGSEGCAQTLATPEDEIVEVEQASFEPVPVWILACDPEICDLENPSQADLEDPYGWLQRLPIEGVSLATRTVVLAESLPEPRPDNPVPVDTPPETPSVEARSSRTLRFEVPGALRAWGYSTAGGFERPVVDIGPAGRVGLTWFAPKRGDAARLYVVFEDDDGGIAVWRGEAAVR